VAGVVIAGVVGVYVILMEMGGQYVEGATLALPVHGFHADFIEEMVQLALFICFIKIRI